MLCTAKSSPFPPAVQPTGTRKRNSSSRLLPQHPHPTDDDSLKRSNYDGVAGSGRVKSKVLEKTQCGDLYLDGVLVPDDKRIPSAPTNVAKITDGTSKTLAVGERIYLFDDWMTGIFWALSPAPMKICSEASKNIVYTPNSDVGQIGYYVGDSDAPTGGPFKLLATNSSLAAIIPAERQFVFADGSVHMLTDAIDINIFKDLASIAGGEVNDWTD